MEPQQFNYRRPENDRSKNLTVLCKTDRLSADVQLVKEGGENKLHSHTVSDGFFMVLEGAVKFYGEGDVVLAELGAREGIVIPHGFKYRFCLAPLNEVVRAVAGTRQNATGDGEDLAVLLEGLPGGDQRAALDVPLDNEGPEADPGHDAVSARKELGAWARANRIVADERAVLDDVPGERDVL